MATVHRHEVLILAKIVTMSHLFLYDVFLESIGNIVLILRVLTDSYENSFNCARVMYWAPAHLRWFYVFQTVLGKEKQVESKPECKEVKGSGDLPQENWC